MAFQAHTINLTSGVRQDVSEKSVGSPQMLDTATNVVIAHSNALRGRPTLVSEDAIIQKLNTGGTPDVPASTLSAFASGTLVSAGLETANNQLLALFQSTAFAKSPPTYNGVKTWRELGPFWSVNKSSINALDARNANSMTNPVAVGTTLVSTSITANSSTGLGIVSNGLAILDTQSLSNFDSVSSLHACIATDITTATDVILYPKADGSLRYHSITPSVSTGSGTEVLVAAAGQVDIPVSGVGVAAVGQSCWLVKGNSSVTGEFFFAYKGTTPGQIIVGRLVVGTGVVATLTLTGLGVIAWGVALSHNGGPAGGSGALSLGFYDQTSGIYKSKIINVTSTTSLADAGINVSYAATGTTSYAPHTLGVDVSNSFTVCFGTSTGLSIYLASYTSAANTLRISLFNGFKVWFPLTTSIVYMSRTFITLQGKSGFTALNTAPCNNQWVVLDITNNLFSLVTGGPIIAAAGVVNGSVPTYPINAIIGTTAAGNPTYKFGIVEGITFDVNGPQTSGASVVTLTPKASKSVTAGGVTIFSGNVPYQFDGNQTYPLNYVEGAPILRVTNTVGGTTPVGATYTAQCIWEFTNAGGQIVRSAQSNVGLTGAIAANSVVKLEASIPQTMGRYLTATNARLKYYISTAAGTGPLYLINTSNFPVTNGVVTAGTILITLFAASPTVDTTQEQLYTGGNILDDQAPSSADRGVCYAINRLWAASDHKVFASKLLTSTINPAFNNSGILVINVPTNLGEVRGLGSLGDKVAVICDTGVLVIFGIGYDDLGNGPGWSTEVISSSGFTSYDFAGPRAVTSINGVGAAYVGKDNEIYLLGYAGVSQCITRQAKDTVFSISELTYCDSFNNTGTNTPIEIGPMLIGSGGSNFLGTTNTVKVVDLESGLVITWSNPTGVNSYHTSINGVLYVTTSAGFPYSYSEYATGVDATFGSVTQSIQTARCSVSGIEEGYNAFLAGRLRGISINGSSVLNNSHTLAVNIVDQDSTVLYNNAAVAETIYTTEYRCTTQRCSNFKITISATPAIAEWTSIDFWSWSSGDRKPNNTRA